MGAYRKLGTLVFGFILYVADVGSDIYVAIQYYKEGLIAPFITTVVFTALPVFIVNIFATYSLKKGHVTLKFASCFVHLAMVHLFIEELYRWKEDSEHSHNGKHFSKCECTDCINRFKSSSKATLDSTLVRYMEAFAESAPQCCFQVIVMRNSDGTPPWYRIASISVSFLSMLWSIYLLEKAYWVNRRVEQDLRPATYPKKSAFVFVLWQLLLLLARCLTVAILPPNYFVIVFLILIHYFAIVYLMYWFFRKSSCRTRCIISISSFATSYPWHFHLSTSGLEVPNKCFHKEEDVVKIRKFIRYALFLVPFLFALEGTILILFFSELPKTRAYDALKILGGTILAAYVMSLIYYHSRCHPFTRISQVRPIVVKRGIINVQPINDDE
ncbi:cell death abnormality protein 8-like [Dendronephthya gigantea]|uniref:cell death abnormality protein 8-like n=1 Tax=Dendronephthya gigantea TaxID=151771 RepID=UPI001069B654|nr:cell death abnormality protein 8-like [Dendronephthya gigantea]